MRKTVKRVRLSWEEVIAIGRIVAELSYLVGSYEANPVTVRKRNLRVGKRRMMNIRLVRELSTGVMKEGEIYSPADIKDKMRNLGIHVSPALITQSIKIFKDGGMFQPIPRKVRRGRSTNNTSMSKRSPFIIPNAIQPLTSPGAMEIMMKILLETGVLQRFLTGMIREDIYFLRNIDDDSDVKMQKVLKVYENDLEDHEELKKSVKQLKEDQIEKLVTAYTDYLSAV